MYFTESKELRKYEKMMKIVPGFDRDSNSKEPVIENKSSTKKISIYEKLRIRR